VIALPFSLVVDGRQIVDVLLPYLERIIMNDAEIKTAIEEVTSAVGGIKTNLDTGVAQLAKAQDEIIVALNKLGITSPETDAAMANLRTAVAGLGVVATSVGTVAGALDGLNPDVVPAP
jgi:hypothetical protein